MNFNSATRLAIQIIYTAILALWHHAGKMPVNNKEMISACNYFGQLPDFSSFHFEKFSVFSHGRLYRLGRGVEIKVSSSGHPYLHVLYIAHTYTVAEEVYPAIECFAAGKTDFDLPMGSFSCTNHSIREKGSLWILKSGSVLVDQDGYFHVDCYHCVRFLEAIAQFFCCDGVVLNPYKRGYRSLYQGCVFILHCRFWRDAYPPQWFHSRRRNWLWCVAFYHVVQP